MTNLSFNHWSVAVATLANILVAALWYSPHMFGSQEMRFSGRDEAQWKRERRNILTGYLQTFVATIFKIYILAYAMSFIGPHTIVGGMFIGLLAGLAFEANTLLGGVLWD